MSGDFRSGTSGEVLGIRRTSAAALTDAALDALELVKLQRRRLSRAARGTSRRTVLALAIEGRSGDSKLLAGTEYELTRSRHHVRFASRHAGAAGKFENLNALLQEHPARGNDWLLVVDDDVLLPRGFLDAFIFLAERFDLRLAQPAHRHRSHAAWQVTRRRAGSVTRETSFVEIGPVFAFHASTFEQLLPFPQLRYGWGLDAHWAAVARSRGWRLGVIDALAVTHGVRRIAATYDRAAALEEARDFLSTRPHITSAEAQRTLIHHRSWR